MKIETLPPTEDLPPFLTFGDCKKGETSAKTGCTPKSGGGGKKESEAPSSAASDSGKDKTEYNLNELEDIASEMDIDVSIKEEVLHDLFDGDEEEMFGLSSADFESWLDMYQEDLDFYSKDLETYREDPDIDDGDIELFENLIEKTTAKAEAMGKLKEVITGEPAGSGSGKKSTDNGKKSVDNDKSESVIEKDPWETVKVPEKDWTMAVDMSQAYKAGFDIDGKDYKKNTRALLKKLFPNRQVKDFDVVWSGSNAEIRAKFWKEGMPDQSFGESIGVKKIDGTEAFYEDEN